MTLWNTVKGWFGLDSNPETDDTLGFEIALIEGGYQILRDGAVVVNQPFKPGVSGFEPFESPEAAAAAADLEIRAIVAAEQSQT